MLHLAAFVSEVVRMHSSCSKHEQYTGLSVETGQVVLIAPVKDTQSVQGGP